jgi:hypothetical protein
LPIANCHLSVINCQLLRLFCSDGGVKALKPPAAGKKPWRRRSVRSTAVEHEPPAHPMKEKAEDEDEHEDEDDGCRRDCAPTTDYRLFGTETRRPGRSTSV